VVPIFNITIPACFLIELFDRGFEDLSSRFSVWENFFILTGYFDRKKWRKRRDLKCRTSSVRNSTNQPPSFMKLLQTFQYIREKFFFSRCISSLNPSRECIFCITIQSKFLICHCSHFAITQFDGFSLSNLLHFIVHCIRFDTINLFNLKICFINNCFCGPKCVI